MLNKYEELNDDSRDYFLVLLANKVKDEMILNNQVNIVNNNKNELFIIKEKWYKKIFDKIKNFFRRK